MLGVSFIIESPIAFKESESKDYVNYDKKIMKNKSLSIQISKWNKRYPDLIVFAFRLSWRGEDHAGLYFSVGFFDLSFIINFYDHRHWNYEKDKWEIYET